MPQLGETVAEGKITKWFKSAGDAVKPGDNLFEIETDKVSMEVPSITAGTLTEIKVQAGETALVGAVVAVIAGEGGAAASAPAASSARRSRAAQLRPLRKRAPGQTCRRGAAAARDPARPAQLDPFFEVRTPSRNFGPAKTAGGTFVTPLARRLAGENGIDLSRMSGSGPHGRIVAADIEVRHRQGRRPRRADGDRAPAPAQVKALYQGVEFEEVPLDGMRATIARRLVEAKQTIPHFYLVADVTMDALLKIREEANAGAPKGRRGLQALGQRFRHQGAGARLAARAGGQRGVGRRPHPALQAFRRRRRGRDRRRAAHAGDPQRRRQNRSPPSPTR